MKTIFYAPMYMKILTEKEMNKFKKEDKKMNINQNKYTKMMYELMGQIEICGGSEELTKTIVMAGDIMQELHDDERLKESMPFVNHNLKETKTYIGTKVIKATSMSLEEFKQNTGKEIEPTKNYGQIGYLVEYEDGYKSWSPKEVFERCYREVTESEKRMI